MCVAQVQSIKWHKMENYTTIQLPESGTSVQHLSKCTQLLEISCVSGQDETDLAPRSHKFHIFALDPLINVKFLAPR